MSDFAVLFRTSENAPFCFHPCETYEDAYRFFWLVSSRCSDVSMMTLDSESGNYKEVFS